MDEDTGCSIGCCIGLVIAFAAVIAFWLFVGKAAWDLAGKVFG